MSIDRITVGELLSMIAARKPTPGGGAVAALAAALAAALGEMVVRYRIGKPAAAEHEATLAEVADALSRLRLAELQLADADVAAFERLSALWKLPPDERRRVAQWPDAVDGAIDPPRRVLSTSLEILGLLDRVRETVGTTLRSDLAISAMLALTAVEAAAWNVRINLPQLDDPGRAAELEAEAADGIDRARALRDLIERTSRAPGTTTKAE